MVRMFEHLMLYSYITCVYVLSYGVICNVSTRRDQDLVRNL